jgi:hypothetical protein
MRDHDPTENERQERRRRRLRRPVLAAAALAWTAMLTAACGSGGSSGAGTAAGSPGGGARGSALAYSRCMRAHGITRFPDPDSQGGISVTGGPGTSLDPNSPQFKAADQACRKLMPGANLSPAQQAANEARALRYSQCMRAHGIPDFPDPNGQGGIAIRLKPGSDLDPNNPVFKSADSACKHFMTGSGTGQQSLSSSGASGAGQ